MAEKVKEDIIETQKTIKKFSIGNLAVYPAHGVGRIEAIESRVINGEKQDFYIMKILENSMVIMIPTQNVDSVGLRDIIEHDKVESIYTVMRDRNIPHDNQTWNRRYRDYMEKIKTGSLHEVAGVFRDLFLLKLTKELSFGERKLLDTAQSLLIKELSIAKNAKEKQIMDEIKSIFHDAILEAKKNESEDENDKNDKSTENEKPSNDAQDDITNQSNNSDPSESDTSSSDTTSESAND